MWGCARRESVLRYDRSRRAHLCPVKALLQCSRAATSRDWREKEQWRLLSASCVPLLIFSELAQVIDGCSTPCALSRPVSASNLERSARSLVLDLRFPLQASGQAFLQSVQSSLPAPDWHLTNMPLAPGASPPLPTNSVSLNGSDSGELVQLSALRSSKLTLAHSDRGSRAMEDS